MCLFFFLPQGNYEAALNIFDEQVSSLDTSVVLMTLLDNAFKKWGGTTVVCIVIPWCFFLQCIMIFC